ncbi:DUF2785 domain-containing protein [Fructobacillus sp. M2-14]|uniref:DUF2785 domain-containing protein n=1 Tax=Fructobacillus broussonetiae TaxID=2713173 RepID=A0ABS5R0H6_9LACO|nr:DUF2785 domain-containing protein [Fructobacillus broussonetiae]MBS9338958.1 DUF2785 domain-containing protein [Fructobacillus broussonetiae]
MEELDSVYAQLHFMLDGVKQGKLLKSLPDMLFAIRQDIKYGKETPMPPLLSAYESLDQMAAYQDLWKKEENGEIAPSTMDSDDLRRFLLLLSATDSTIRDTGAFFFLGNAVTGHHLSNEQLRTVVAELTDESRLLSHVLEEKNDGAFYRSYCLALLAILINEDQNGSVSFIDDEMKENIVLKLSVLMLAEKDTRGYTEESGWVHIYSHLANVLGALFEDPKLARADKLFLLACLMTNLRTLDTPLTMGEMGRLVGTILSLAKRHALYAEYLLLTLKLWRQDLVNEPFVQSRSRWQKLYNRVDFFQQILAFGENGSPKEVWEYAQATKNYLS